MVTFILIIFMKTSGGGLATAEFLTKSRCEAALIKFKEEHRRWGGFCIKK